LEEDGLEEETPSSARRVYWSIRTPLTMAAVIPDNGVPFVLNESFILNNEANYPPFFFRSMNP